MTRAAHKRWLKVTAVVVAIGGPIFFLGTMVATAEAARLTLDILSWPLDGVQTFAEPTTRFLSALTGGFLVGWGVMIWCLSGAVFDAAPEGVRRAVVTGTLCWFAVDSAGSVASGNDWNVLFNVIVLLLVVGPMWRPARG